MPEKTCTSLFQSCEETTKPEVAQINGSIPSWLNGTFIRTGPAKWDFPGFTMNHWFDGYALLSKFSINGAGAAAGDGGAQTVTLEQKYLKSDAYTRGCCAQRPVITEFGTRAYPDPQKTFFSRILCAVLPVELSDNGNLSVFELGSELFASSETCYFRHVTANLESGEKYDTNKYFGVNIASAHPQTDPETGYTYNIGCNVLPGLKYNVIKIPPPAPGGGGAKEMLKKSKVIATIPATHSGLLSHIHSFGMTRNYIILIEQPYVMNIARAAKTIMKGSPVFKDFVEWRPELRNRFHVIEKESGTVVKTEYIAQDNFFYLHIINAYEDDNQIVVDLMSYKNSDFMDSTYLALLREGRFNEDAFQATAVRYVLPLVTNVVLASQPAAADTTTGTNLVHIKSHATAFRMDKSIILTPETLSLPGLENPAYNRKCAGTKYGYFYAAGTPGQQHKYSNSIVKYDLRKKETVSWVGKAGQLAGEPQFIANPMPKTTPTGTGSATKVTKTPEDDGVLLSVVSDLNPGKNGFILFLDAKTMTEIGRTKFQNHIPVGIHGIYLPATAAEASSTS